MVQYQGIWMKTERTLSGAVFRHTIPFRKKRKIQREVKTDAEYQIRKEKSQGDQGQDPAEQNAHDRSENRDQEV